MDRCVITTIVQTMRPLLMNANCVSIGKSRIQAMADLFLEEEKLL